MNNDIKSGVGYIIPSGAIVGFFTALFLGEYLFSIYIAIAGILVWFLYMVIMESSPPSNLGNLIIFFGVLLSIGVFMGFGVTQNMWGGIEFVSEGLIPDCTDTENENEFQAQDIIREKLIELFKLQE